MPTVIQIIMMMTPITIPATDTPIEALPSCMAAILSAGSGDVDLACAITTTPSSSSFYSVIYNRKYFYR